MMMMMMMMMIMIITITIFLNRFPAHDELGTCRTSLVSPEQPVLCIPVRPTKTTILTITFSHCDTGEQAR